MQILKGHQAAVRSITYSRDSERLISSGNDGQVIVWNLSTGRAVNTYTLASEGSSTSMEVVTAVPGSGSVAIALPNGRVELWDVDTVGQRDLLRVDEPFGPISSIAASSDRLAIGGWRSRAAIWDLHDRHRLPSLIELTSPVTGVTWACQQEWLALCCYKGTVQLLDPQSPTRSAVQLGNGKPLLTISSAHRSSFVAVAGMEGMIKIWDVFAREEVQELTGHQWVVHSVAFSPDDQYLVSGSADKTVRVWNVPLGREERSYRWHESWVTSVAVAPDGMTAAAGSDDHTIVVWDFDEL